VHLHELAAGPSTASPARSAMRRTSVVLLLRLMSARAGEGGGARWPVEEVASRGGQMTGSPCTSPQRRTTNRGWWR
jgi:hypothetical protein